MELPENKTNKKGRPELLTLLCILTFIGSGLAAFSYFFIFISYDEIGTMMKEMDFDFSGFEIMMSGGKRFFAAGFILYSISLGGAIQMWKLNKIGFHLYTAAQVFILILPVVMIKSLPFSIFSLLLTLVFILGFFSQLKFMK